MADAALALSRLRWRCRRGTRELDTLLTAWLDTRAVNAAEPMLADFAALLDIQDPQLWDWLSGHSPPESRFVAIVEDIRR